MAHGILTSYCGDYIHMAHGMHPVPRVDSMQQSRSPTGNLYEATEPEDSQQQLVIWFRGEDWNGTLYY